MKKIFLLAAAAIAMVGCAQNEEVYTADAQQEIALSTVTANSTRAAGEQSGALASTHELYISSWYTGTVSGADNYFTDVLFATTGTSWTGTTPQYYPLSGDLDFYAIAGESLATATRDWTLSATDRKLTMTGVTVDGTDDIVYGELESVDCPQIADQTLPLYHALSALEFKFVNKQDRLTEITINDITVTANMSGNVVVDYNATDYLSAVVWSNQATNTVSVDHAADLTLTTGANGDFNVATDLGHLVVPGKRGYVVLTYTVKGPDSTTGAQSTHKVYLNDDTESLTWLPGTKYIYTITIDAHEITFATDVQDWDDTISVSGTVDGCKDGNVGTGEPVQDHNQVITE